MSRTRRSSDNIAELKARYDSLQRSLAKQPWILQGSVNERPPPPESTAARTTYTWTRKVRGKTVTVALSPQQARAFQRAIEANRRLEETLAAMRQISHTALTRSLPGVKKIARSKTAKNER
jgi:hypothetical protein